MTTGKIMALTRWTFVSKVMSLLFNMLSRLVIAFLPRTKRFLISWLQSSSAVILEPKKIQFITAFISPLLFAKKGPYSQSYGFSSSHVWMRKLDHNKRHSAEELMLLNCGVGEDS